MLEITTFGSFRISDGTTEKTDWENQFLQLVKLLLYLLLHRNEAVSTEKLVEAVWQEAEMDHPFNALKNLMYRLRKTLTQAFGKENYIVSKRGTYQWNPDMKVQLDCEQLEQWMKAAKEEPEIKKRQEYYRKVVELYQGEFMNRMTDMHWVLVLHTHYHALFLAAVYEMARWYLAKEQYGYVENLCSEVLKREPADEQLYAFLIRGQLYNGHMEAALKTYEYACKMIQKELGIYRSELLEEAYQEVLAEKKGTLLYNIGEIKEEMKEDAPAGVFLCGYPVFRGICHLQMRKSVRTNIRQRLLLITVEQQPGDPKEIARFRIRQAMRGLEQVMGECLRVGDVVAKYSDCQFVLLLEDGTEELAMLVVGRIVKRLKKEDKRYAHVRFKVDVTVM